MCHPSFVYQFIRQRLSTKYVYEALVMWFDKIYSKGEEETDIEHIIKIFKFYLTIFFP